jgi:hypothetical protein
MKRFWNSLSKQHFPILLFAIRTIIRAKFLNFRVLFWPNLIFSGLYFKKRQINSSHIAKSQFLKAGALLNIAHTYYDFILCLYSKQSWGFSLALIIAASAFSFQFRTQQWCAVWCVRLPKVYHIKMCVESEFSHQQIKILFLEICVCVFVSL